MADRKTTLKLHVPPAVARRLKKLSDMTERAPEDHAGVAIEEYLDVQESHLRAVEEGLEDVRQGRTRPADEVFKDLRAEHARRLRRKRRA